MPFRKPEQIREADKGFEGSEILLVEDSRAYTVALRKRLETDYGMKVTSCATLELLASALEENPDRFTLSLIDLNLPGTPSGEALDLVSAKNVPAILFTSNASDLRRKQVLTKQFADYVLKDGQKGIERLIEATVRILSNRSAHILIVDDSALMRDMLSEQLLSQLYRVTSVASSRQALEVLDENTEFDLALINHLMPEMNGLALVEQIRSRTELDDMRIIGVSTLEDKSLAARFLRAGANDFLIQPLVIEELRGRVAQNIEISSQIGKLRELAARDYLTGIYNRRHFFENGPRRVALSRKQGRGQALAIVDIDHFKLINDTYGHEVGDVVLKAVACQLRKYCGHSHLLSRMGGEEFGILISDCSFADARRFCEFVRYAIEFLLIKTDDGDVKVTVSIGLAEIADKESFDNYLNAADQFLYMAKSAGRNRVFSETDLAVRAVA
ncbi:diguanylate cyclase (GGDEF) domain-containing protein [Hoeflea sp. IMCC20628]|uniref:GGDEF domain-containing response regulator n=1 Tax=Hoeflea sp. IMCC20628 TaxID=1620421 RepID=UPI00063A8D52|nr:diguanylate cyclase [Hoeflea sp. IMCC20628]AKH99731.1 diguanylate cyclase (GGDEF) domain-containing protein [Hoeflea sp. IMCC20628]